ncbi:MAG: hypothetical protein U5K51_03735 [Flavobacteriaceae bacterium]|nr:hypothetical protein [Flavobacteriaceae bacterium]
MLLGSTRSDLKIKPAYHKESERIEAMTNISFVSYALYKELERILHKRSPEIGILKAIKEISGNKGSRLNLPKVHERINKPGNKNQ